jgi:hypothetical protein
LNILGRAPEVGAVDAWYTGYFLVAINASIDVRFVFQEMGRLFFQSQEYANRNRTRAEFLTDCYQAFLRRQPAQVEIDAWLADTSWIRPQVVSQFAQSAEFSAYIKGLFPGLDGEPAPTTIPGTDPGFALSFHSYAIDLNGEINLVRFGVEAAERDGAPLLMTEFGASVDPVLLNRLTAQFDARIVPWMFWSYDGEIVRDQHAPLTPDSVVSQAALDALMRPYPVATTGVPTHIAFDPETKVFDFEYDPARVGGGHFPRRLDTLVFVPKRHYPNGYNVEVSGARVMSEPCATELRLRTKRTRRPPRRVLVRITPGLSGRDRSCP